MWSLGRPRDFSTQHPGGPPLLARCIDNLGLLRCAQGRANEAEPLMLDALSIRRMALGQAHPDVARSLHDLACLRQAQLL